MKAITLWQPWASLVALGHKRIETRSWSTTYRGPLAIHASKRVAGRRGERWPIGDFEVERDASGYLLRGPVEWPYRLPLGEVVAIAELADVVPMFAWSPLDGPAATAVHAPRSHFDEPIVLLRDARGASEIPPPPGTPEADNVTDQIPYGDFRPGRFAWLLDDIQHIKPVPAMGRQGLWKWER